MEVFDNQNYYFYHEKAMLFQVGTMRINCTPVIMTKNLTLMTTAIWFFLYLSEIHSLHIKMVLASQSLRTS